MAPSLNSSGNQTIVCLGFSTNYHALMRMRRSQLLFTALVACHFLGTSSVASAPQVARNAGPALHGVTHEPQQPKSGESVTVTARVSDPSENRAVTLRVQVVQPGGYIRKTDAAYENSWRDVPMHDDGREGDARAADGIFSAVVPADFQKHRRLMRYRFVVSNTKGTTTSWPPATNECPNLAWFVYDGVPEWTGASKPGATPALTFSSEFLTTLPVYHLIAQADDVERSQWDQGSNRKPFLGTLVYEGKVYDHIQFHNRGQASTYLAGKNKWAFKLNLSQPFHARDVWGQPYKHPWISFNMNACASPWAQVNRGMAGMDEAVSFRAYQLAGVPSPNTHWFIFVSLTPPKKHRARVNMLAIYGVCTSSCRKRTARGCAKVVCRMETFTVLRAGPNTSPRGCPPTDQIGADSPAPPPEGSLRPGGAPISIYPRTTASMQSIVLPRMWICATAAITISTIHRAAVGSPCRTISTSRHDVHCQDTLARHHRSDSLP